MEKILNFLLKERKKKALLAIIIAGIFFIVSCFILPIVFDILTIVFLFFGSILLLQEKFSKNVKNFNLMHLKRALLRFMTALLTIHLLGCLLNFLARGPFMFNLSASLRIIGVYMLLVYLSIYLYLLFKYKCGNLEKYIFMSIICVVGVYVILGADINIFMTFSSSSSTGCEICGDSIFAGKFCKKHFNAFAG